MKNSKELIDEEIKKKPITEDEIDHWAQGTFSNHLKSYILDILNGKYSLEEAREDVLSFRKEFNTKKEE